MTALTLTPRIRLRPKALLAASLVVVVVSQLTAVVSRAPILPVPAPVSLTDPAGDGTPALPESPGGPTAASAGGVTHIDRSIRVWTANLAANDRDFYSATNLGLLYDARARLTGDVSDYGRAIVALETALAIVPDYLPARLLYARELAATHDFVAALAEARAIDVAAPGEPQAIATIGDAALELGDIATAEAAYTELSGLAPGAATTARLARLAYLRGDTAAAIALAATAENESSVDEDTEPSRSWYAYLSGVLAMAAGDPATALLAFDRASGLQPDSYLALTGRARALAAQGRTDEAIAAYQSAVAISPQPDTLAALGDLYALAGDEAAATQQYDTVEFIGSLAAVNEQVYNRSLVLFWLNHDRNAVQALTMAETELQRRKDIFGWDAYAWALLANGRAPEADAAMANALALGTRDATLHYHAAIIATAVGDTARARTMLEQALALDGALDPLAATRARDALADLP